MQRKHLVFALGLMATPALATETTTYRYDALGRLVQVDRTGGASNGVSATYSHDNAGNRTRVLVTGASH